MKKKYFLTIDTETAGDLRKPLVYDVGFSIVDIYGNVYESASFVNYDIYVKEKELMKSAYYADKLPQYEADIKAGRRRLAKFFTIRKTVLDAMKRWDVEAVGAYNTGFDKRALNNTQRHTTDGKYRYFFPKGTKFIDIWTMACNSIFKTPSFRKMAYENEWYSPKGNVRTNAEVAYAFISGQLDFIESHTALEDVEIETAIMAYCWRKTTPEQREIVGCPWRIPQKEWYYTEDRKDRGLA